MASFTTRVELHKAYESDYEVLHAAMGREGFTRTINSSFIIDDRFQKISRYFLLKFEWSFNKMPGGDIK